jgi:hypothetical protein
MSKPVAKPRINRSQNTQLINIMDLPHDRAGMKAALKARLIFDPATYGAIPGDEQLGFHRINVGITNPDGTQGDVVFGMDRSFSFGVSENRSKETKALQGYSYPISLYDRDGATEHQLLTVQFIELCAEVAIEHMLKAATRDEVNDYKYQEANLMKFNPLYYKEEKGVRIEGASPTFYPKLMWYKAGKNKRGKEVGERMFSRFYAEDEVDENGDPLPLNPLDFQNKKHNTTPAIKWEGIFFGKAAKNTQWKLYEAYVKEAESGAKRLLRTAARSQPTIVAAPATAAAASKAGKDEAGANVASSASAAAPQSPVATSKPAAPVPERKLAASDDEHEEEDEEEEKPKKPKKGKKGDVKRVKVPAAAK